MRDVASHGSWPLPTCRCFVRQHEKVLEAARPRAGAAARNAAGTLSPVSAACGFVENVQQDTVHDINGLSLLAGPRAKSHQGDRLASWRTLLEKGPCNVAQATVIQAGTSVRPCGPKDPGPAGPAGAGETRGALSPGSGRDGSRQAGAAHLPLLKGQMLRKPSSDPLRGGDGATGRPFLFLPLRAFSSLPPSYP